jgi:hypothetical protein
MFIGEALRSIVWLDVVAIDTVLVPILFTVYKLVLFTAVGSVKVTVELPVTK